ncbi:MAG: VWA domain-containing protein, partial [Caldilineales bacterium]|nr:VWA domain-containing protein [Caldilineales bacterium]
MFPIATGQRLGYIRRHTLVRVAVVFFLLASYVLGLSSPIKAQQETQRDISTTPPYGGIDLVFLVDQSGSMRVNDPYSQRANAIKWVLQYLGIDNLYSRREAIHRVGVVSFGTGAEIDLELVPLRSVDEIEWNDRYKELEQKVVAKNMVNTDVLEGLRLVKQVFDSASTVSGGARTRGIIILTDGAPYREGWQQDPRYAGTNFYTPYFREMGEFIRENFPIAQSPRSTEGYHIWVLGLNAREETGQQAAPG